MELSCEALLERQSISLYGEAMERPLVSVILPVFDRAHSIARAIESVLAQTYAPVELIVAHGGSPNGTAEIVAPYRGRAVILRQDHRGAYAARNAGLRHARGELVAFVDSDDRWLPDKLERQVPLMKPGVGLVYGDVRIVAAPHDQAPPTGRTAFRTVKPRRGQVLEQFAWGNFVPTCTALVRKSALDEIGGFPDKSRLSADYLTWFRLARRHRFDFVDAPVAVYTSHADGISFDLGRSLAARIALFEAEREGSDDRETRHILDRLLFHLGLHLALAALRGRARHVEAPFLLARRACSAMDSGRALWSIGAFAADQLKLRTRRLLP